MVKRADFNYRGSEFESWTCHSAAPLARNAKGNNFMKSISQGNDQSPVPGFS